MKKLLLSTLLIIILILPSMSQTKRKDSLTRPSFEFQKTYILQQSQFNFIPVYNIWKHHPVHYIDYATPKELKEAKLFEARQKIELAGNNFIIHDRIKDVKLNLKEDSTTADIDIKYIINKKDSVLGTITGEKHHDSFIYSFYYNGKEYQIEGEINKLFINIYSFVFTIKDQEKTLCYIFKQYKYVKNEYEIIINTKFRSIEDNIFVCLAVFIDKMLKDNGYIFK